MALLCKSIWAYVGVAWNKNVISLDGRHRPRLHLCCAVWWITWKLNRSHRTAISISENIWNICANGKNPNLCPAVSQMSFQPRTTEQSTVRSYSAHEAPMTPPTSNRYPSLFKMKIKMKTRSQQRAQWKHTHTQEKKKKSEKRTNGEWIKNKKEDEKSTHSAGKIGDANAFA